MNAWKEHPWNPSGSGSNGSREPEGETGTGGLKVQENWECLEQVNDASVGKPGMCPGEEPSDTETWLGGMTWGG